MVVVQVFFWLSAVAIGYAMVGYPITLLLLDKILKPKTHEQDYSLEPTVTVMIVAHNEEKVIWQKLENVLRLNYPKDKIEILVASDNSTDRTNALVNEFIATHPNDTIKLFEVKERKGKTNAQNEAQKTVQSEILVMTDANAMLDKESVRELVSMFTVPDILYVAGRLAYTNSFDNLTSFAESTYWNLDLRMRDIESRIQTITAGNGALYAIRNEAYIDFDPIRCHDSAMPKAYGLERKKALFCPKAIAYEKAGENDGDEFKRKIRMSRGILRTAFPNPRMLNIFKLKWFSFFYFGHRTLRAGLFMYHIVLLISNIVLAVAKYKFFYYTLALQIAFYLIALLHKLGWHNRYFKFISYYSMTILAQSIGAYRMITGQSKPFWEKAESTR